MFGDDLDPTVTTAWVGFGGGFGHAHEGSERGQRGQGPDKMTMEAKRERATATGYEVL